MRWRAYLRSVGSLPGVHRAPPAHPPWRVAAPVIALAAALALVWGAIYAAPLARAQAHLGWAIDPRLLAIAAMLGAQAVAARLGQVPLADAGLGPRAAGRPRAPRALGGALARALAWLAVLWVAAQLALGAAALLSGAGLQLAAPGREPARALAALGFQLLAIALVEEAVFRGWLVPQLYAHLRPRRSEARALIGAVVGAGVLFSIAHLPAALARGWAGRELAAYLADLGWHALLYSALYLRTGDLPFAIALHALANEPSAIVEAPLRAGDVYTALVVLRIAVQPVLEGERGHRGALRWLRGERSSPSEAASDRGPAQRDRAPTSRSVRRGPRPRPHP